MNVITTSSDDFEPPSAIPVEKHQISLKNDHFTDNQNPTEKLEAEEKTASDVVTPGSNEAHNEEPIVSPSTRLIGVHLYLLGFALAIGNLMMAMDASILGPAIPRITSDFHTLDDIGWYTSAYLLAQLSCQPVFGRFFLYFQPKLWYSMFVLVFEVGSVLCATAPNSPAFVLGRAVAGCGAAGILTGSIAIYGDAAPMRERPRGMALIASFQSIAYMSGPVLSGALTGSRLTWRFCFWINLPIGFISAVVVFFVVERKPSPQEHLPLLEKLVRLDLAGSVLLTGSLVCLFLALEWGGTVLAWSAPTVWGCLLGFGLIAVIFVFYQALRGNKAVIPLRILHQRTVVICCIFSSLYGCSIVVHSMLLPTYFQTVHGISTTMSGVYYLPMTLASTLCIVITGFTITACGYYVPFLWIGSLLYMAGSTLLHSLKTSSTAAQYLGYQVVTGAGFGLTIHVSLIAVQVASKPEHMSTAIVMEIFFNQLGGAVGASVGQNLFLGTLRSRLRGIMTAGEASAFAQDGLGNMVKVMKGLSGEEQEQIKDALNSAITTAFIVPIVATALAAIVSWGAERRKIEDEEPELTGEAVSVSESV